MTNRWRSSWSNKNQRPGRPSPVGRPSQLESSNFAAAEWQAVSTALQRLIDAEVLSPSGHGNLSTRLGDNPSSLLLKDLASADLAALTLTGQVEQGYLSAETQQIVPMHTVVYELRPEVGAVLHTHSPYVTVFALAQKPLPCYYESLLHYGQVQDIPVAAWGPRGSAASVEAIRVAIRQHPNTQAVLLANHGVLVFGPDPLSAANLLIAIEEAAAATLRATALGGALAFPEGAFTQIQASTELVAISQ
ncbi:class II aldolase/adducin family protein [Leptolyngbya sp. FACHB-261]|uniref:class II aldolase/adducin family protein n=1 Tax=Leptolyngbya sp. FACHB-261 TaxID=2692806 RepID=UPI001685334A|nr:class II aldolase/adducin family protein [Leptolyngbya sp. FACHB-261]MBD2103685.1 class II aldolase/adducin family protein [Leptolyngbya sp. FACHB-261]